MRMRQPCAVCGGSGARRLLARPVAQCTSCGLVRTADWDTVMRTSAADIQATKEEYYDRVQYAWDSWARLLLEEAELQRPAGRILDVGCGPGAMVDYFNREGRSAVGIDINENDIAYAHKRGFGDVVHHLSVDDVPQSLGTFDTVILNHVLEHVADPVSLLCSLRAVLDDDGQIIVAVPNFASLGSRLLLSKWYGLQPETHFHHFNAKSLVRTAQAARFQVISIRSRTTVGTDYHVHQPSTRLRRLYARLMWPLAERLAMSDQLLARLIPSCRPPSQEDAE